MSTLYPNARLLIVDDCVANVSLLHNVLNRLGFNQIESITDSRGTFERVESFRPDLILLDLNMPHLDGFTVLQKLPNVIPRDTFLPVLVLTADATGASKRRALAAGATDLITKPFNTSEVFMRIRNLLQIRFLHLQLQTHNQTLETKVAERTRELQEMQQQVVAQERLRAFGEMAGGVVHDFNNALMSVIGYSEILLEDENTLRDLATAREFLTIMNTAGKDAAQVISRLRDFYRPREILDVFTRVDLNALIEQAVALTQPKWKGQALASGRTIRVELDLAPAPPVSGSASELREVVTNLVFNAVDAMPGDGAITLRSHEQEGQTVLEVTDTGCGMSEEVRQRCLEPFFTTKGEKGTGLGLSMVFGIVKRHEGSVEIESVPGRGTTIRIRLPALRDASDEAEDGGGKMNRALRVLVVDDEVVTREVFTRYLKNDGHSVVTADNAEQALDYLQEKNFDLLITDHAMPGMSGTQLAACPRVKQAGVPVILITGFAAGSMGDGGAGEGVGFIMHKPVSQRSLRQALISVSGG